MVKRGSLLRWLALMLSLIGAGPARAEPALPYWASLRAAEVNMRVGPGEDYRILWVFRRQHLPVKVLRGSEGWRLVQDRDGARGWVLLRLLSHERSYLVIGKGEAALRASADAGAPVLLRLAPGVSGKLGSCAAGWCRAEAAGKAGYLPQDRLWGADR